MNCCWNTDTDLNELPHYFSIEIQCHKGEMNKVKNNEEANLNQYPSFNNNFQSIQQSNFKSNIENTIQMIYRSLFWENLQCTVSIRMHQARHGIEALRLRQWNIRIGKARSNQRSKSVIGSFMSHQQLKVIRADKRNLSHRQVNGPIEHLIFDWW